MSRELETAEIDISSKPELRHRLIEEYGWRTVPLGLSDNKLAGGFRELIEPGRTGTLDRVMNTVETRADCEDRAAGI